MGLFKSVLSTFTGSSGAAAQKGAAAARVGAIEEAEKEVRAGEEAALDVIQPFREAGATDLTGLASLITDPERQAEFIEESPFFDALADKAKRDLLQTQATTGRLGAGETAEELQKRLVTLGSDLLTQDVGRRMNLAQLGLSGATTEAGIETGTAANIANLLTGKGEAEAAGILGSTAERMAGAGNLVNLGAKVAGFNL